MLISMSGEGVKFRSSVDGEKPFSDDESYIEWQAPLVFEHTVLSEFSVIDDVGLSSPSSSSEVSSINDLLLSFLNNSSSGKLRGESLSGVKLSGFSSPGQDGCLDNDKWLFFSGSCGEGEELLLLDADEVLELTFTNFAFFSFCCPLSTNPTG